MHSHSCANRFVIFINAMENKYIMRDFELKKKKIVLYYPIFIEYLYYPILKLRNKTECTMLDSR